MSFLDHFSDEHRRLFESAAEVVQLERGQYLLRRGDPGGDIYLLRSGKLEVVDSRASPEVILATLTGGTVVGEMAFIDGSPRSADVRSSTDAEILQWSKRELRSLLTRNPDLGAAFYEAVASLAADRIRSLTNTAMAGALTRTKTTNQAGLARVREEARGIAEIAKSALLETETKLRQDPSDVYAHTKLRELLDELQQSVRTLYVAYPDLDAADEATRVLGRELHPYLVRSSLAERCIRRPQGITGTAEILAHVLVDTAGGDGQLGELLDRWLLDRPTLTALRAFREPTLRLVQQALPTFRNRRVLLLNAGTGSLVAGLMHVLDHPPTVLTIVDQSRDALAFLDAGVTSDSSVELETVHENPAQFALGRIRHAFAPQDVIVLNGLLEYFPDRIATSLLLVCVGLLAPTGCVISTALGPSPDSALLDNVLRWPMIRRDAEGLQRVFEGAGFDIVEEPALDGPAQLVQGRPRPEAMARTARTGPVAPPRVAQ